MELREAAELVQAISKSLRSDPDQFHISVRVIGQQITSQGGTGLRITTTGGGPESTTIGQVVSTDGTSIQISRGKADHIMTEQIHALANSLDVISEELGSPDPEKSKIQAVFDSLKGTWVPGIVIGVLSNILSATLGI